MENLKESLKRNLKELFQFENEDLDFGNYRIMNYKRKEIGRFIEKDLINEIEKYSKIKAYKNLENEIYNHLIKFFSRYYDRGDFISKRKYSKREKYCIPYSGEGVLLYWVNRDQYYVKTTEYFKTYVFKVKDLKVNFKIVEAEEEKGNIKSQDKKFFVLNNKIFDFNEETHELNIYFEYRKLSKEEKNTYKKGNSISQNVINAEIVNVLKKKLPKNSLARLIFEKDPNSKNGKMYLERHLYKYTRRNATDYFIHKNLKGFLEKELDFYIKSAFLDLENLQILEKENNEKLKLYLLGVKVFRNIALKIIELLSQIENFQKKIWEKKKFVINTHYVITLDKIEEYAGEKFLESILDDILGNKKQKEEWEKLFGIKVENKEDLIANNQLKERKWKKLPIDTRFFDEKFKWKLLASLSKNNNLEEILDGILIKSENFQALNLILNKYHGKIQTIYIDPPFNKDQEADYLYKVGYKDATWITMLENRIRLGKELLTEKGSIFVRCDYNGNMYVRLLLNEIFGKDNFRNEISVRRFKKNVMEKNIKKLPEGLDTIYLYAKNPKYFSFVNPFKRKKKKRKGFWRHMGDSSGQGNPKIFFGKELDPPKGKHWKFSQERINKLIKEGKLILQCKYCGYVHNKGIWNGCPICGKDVPQPKYWVEEKDTEVLDSNWSDIYGYSTTWGFQTENSEALLKRVIESTSHEGDLVLDFFLGSGTTTAVAQKLGRKWIGIEMGDHFYTVVLPRMKKVLFYDKSGISKEKDVKEKYNEEKAGGFFKYHTLEQYEDSLENIEFKEDKSDFLYEDPNYIVKYMLRWESKTSKTFLNIDKIKDPFSHKLKIIENYQQKTLNVDLIETFNYLLGLNIKKYKVLEDNERKYIFIFGEKNNQKIVIVWRSIENIHWENDKKVIEKNISDFNPNEIYINGNALVEGFKPIEPLFKSLMFGEISA